MNYLDKTFEIRMRERLKPLDLQEMVKQVMPYCKDMSEEEVTKRMKKAIKQEYEELLGIVRH